MKRHLFTLILVAMTGLSLGTMPGRAEGKLSPKNLDALDQWGWLTPGFKTAVHELVDTKEAIVEAKKEEAALTATVPDLKSKADKAEAAAAGLKQKLAQYEHSDETDFAELQKKMSDTGATLEDQRLMAQTFVWAYPASAHQAEAGQYLQQVQQKLADETQAQKDAEAARVAAYAKLVQRAQAKDLNLEEWRGFLSKMSEEDVLKYIGRPDFQGPSYWTYSGGWTEDPVTHKKVGLQITFDAARVLTVAEMPNP